MLKDWTPEPWLFHEAAAEIQNKDGLCIADLNLGDVDLDGIVADGRRAVACVNACAGIEDPKAAIKAAVEALQAAGIVICGYACPSIWKTGERPPHHGAHEAVVSAIVKLGGKP